MAKVIPGRYTAQTDEPFVVFMIGMRVNRLFAFTSESRNRVIAISFFTKEEKQVEPCTRPASPHCCNFKRQMHLERILKRSCPLKGALQQTDKSN